MPASGLMEPCLRRQRSSSPLHGGTPRVFRTGGSGWICSSAGLLWMVLGGLGILGLVLLVRFNLQYLLCHGAQLLTWLVVLPCRVCIVTWMMHTPCSWKRAEQTMFRCHWGCQ